MSSGCIGRTPIRIRARVGFFASRFYTGPALRPAEADVDHFLPWSRSPLNAVENLVVADRRANRDKSDHLAAVEHVMLWRERNRYHAHDLRHIAHSNRWETTPVETLGVARALYLVLGPANRLWSASNVFVAADVVALRSLLAA